MNAKRLTPSVTRPVRLGVAGLVWTSVGSILLSWSTGWLLQVPRGWALLAGSAGLAIGVGAWRALFSRLASQNAERLLLGPARACMFGFISPKGWLTTASMIVLGATLRHSDLPKSWLAVPYAAIGAALLLASLTYYSRLPEGATS